MSLSYDEQRQQMVVDQLRRRGITDANVLRAMHEVPRHLFVPAAMRDQAYADQALPLENDQTISQPFVVALMAQALCLSPEDQVLDVGTGSGYAAAVLSRVAGWVYSIEREQTLAATARDRLHSLGYENIDVLYGDGTMGLPSFAPFNAIHVAAGAPYIPRPLRQQLAEGGRLVIPVGGHGEQLLLRARRERGETVVSQLGGVRFVPLVGEHSWGG